MDNINDEIKNRKMANFFIKDLLKQLMESQSIKDNEKTQIGK